MERKFHSLLKDKPSAYLPYTHDSPRHSHAHTLSLLTHTNIHTCTYTHTHMHMHIHIHQFCNGLYVGSVLHDPKYTNGEYWLYMEGPINMSDEGPLALWTATKAEGPFTFKVGSSTVCSVKNRLKRRDRSPSR